MTTETNPIISYAIGTAVWVKIYCRIWWPGIVVDENSIPEDLKNFKKGLKQSIAVVKLITEENYEVVQLPDKILMYSCDRKAEFIERALLLSKMQKKGKKMIGNCNMDNFFKDIKSIESTIGGDSYDIEHFETDNLDQEQNQKSFKKE